MKRKNDHRRVSNLHILGIVLLIIPASGVIFAVNSIGLVMEFGLPEQRGTVRPAVPRIDETLIVPLNSQDPVYTEYKYSDWVAISISGSIESKGEFILDGLHLSDELERGSQGGFRGMLIDGESVRLYPPPTPGYRDNHTYRFQHSVWRHLRDTDLHVPKTLGFQMINEAARGLDGVFIVEVSSDSFKYWPRSRRR